MNNWKKAATLTIAFRSNIVSPSKLGPRAKEDYKILLMKRHKKTSFMPTKVVFPGGVLSEADYCSTWNIPFRNVIGKQLSEIITEFDFPASKFPIIKQNDHWPIHPNVAMRICAIRETYEESGILIAFNKHQYDYSRKNAIVEPYSNLMFEDNSNEEWRKRVLKDPFEFIELCNHYKVVPNIWALMEWSNWLTPKNENKEDKRFDTLFYICCLDGASLPPFSPDLNEMTEAYWTSPSDLLQGNMNLAPPQFYEILKFSKFSTLEKLKSEAHSRNYSDYNRVRFLPVMIPCSNGYILAMPGDHLYPREQENMDDITLDLQEITTEEAMESDIGFLNRCIFESKNKMTLMKTIDE